MTEYEENPEFKAAVEKMLADKTLVEFNSIREHENITVLTLLCSRTDAKGEFVACKGPPIVCRKIPAPFEAITGAHYLLIADYYFWNHANEIQQKANLFHALMCINIEDTEKGEVKTSTRKPEVQVFRSEVARFGAHNDVLLDIREALKQSAKQFAENMKAKK